MGQNTHITVESLKQKKLLKIVEVQFLYTALTGNCRAYFWELGHRWRFNFDYKDHNGVKATKPRMKTEDALKIIEEIVNEKVASESDFVEG